MRDIDLMKVMDSKPLLKSEDDTRFICKKCGAHTKTPLRSTGRLTCHNCGGDVEILKG